jgi:DNA-binding transcriptional LysR family regulator
VERPLDLNEIAIFSCVADEGSLTAAAKRLGLPKSTVSRKLSALEEHLRARLLHRSPRRVELTDVGRALHLEARTALAQIGDAAERVNDQRESLSGRIRVAVPTDFGIAVLSPLLCAFAVKYPQISLEIDLRDRKVDLVHAGFDFAVRVGAVGDPALVARQVGAIRGYLAATPEYAKIHGLPETIDDIAKHRYLEFVLGPQYAGHLRLYGPGGTLTDVRVSPVMRVNSLVVLRDALLESLGVARLPTYLGDPLIASGRLVRVMPGYWTGERPIHLVHTGRRLLPARVSLLMDYLAAKLTTAVA